ncbi:MAG: hypothetical protein JWP61_2581 [Friedmanniella sp.]|nr:hypothetical protein [Friedmanniella sp.]
MGDGAWVVVGVGIAVVVVVNLLLWVRPGPRPVGGVREAPAPEPVSPRSGLVSLAFLADSPARSLALGFSHLYGPLGLPRRRHTLTDRMGRAMARVDEIDPYEERRRVGMALVRAGLTGPPGPDPDDPEPDDRPLHAPETDHSEPEDDPPQDRETGRDEPEEPR